MFSQTRQILAKFVTFVVLGKNATTDTSLSIFIIKHTHMPRHTNTHAKRTHAHISDPKIACPHRQCKCCKCVQRAYYAQSILEHAQARACLPAGTNRLRASRASQPVRTSSALMLFPPGRGVGEGCWGSGAGSRQRTILCLHRYSPCYIKNTHRLCKRLCAQPRGSLYIMRWKRTRFCFLSRSFPLSLLVAVAVSVCMCVS